MVPSNTKLQNTVVPFWVLPLAVPFEGSQMPYFAPHYGVKELREVNSQGLKPTACTNPAHSHTASLDSLAAPSRAAPAGQSSDDRP